MRTQRSCGSFRFHVLAHAPSMAALASMTLLCSAASSLAADGASPEGGRAPGVWVALYEIPSGQAVVPELAPGQLPNEILIVATLALGQLGKPFGKMQDHFLTHAEAFLTVTEAGKYTLRLLSDDGSRLWLDGHALINNDGLHGASPVDAEVELSAGPHALRVWHFDEGADEALALQWRPPGAQEFVTVPAAALSYDTSFSKETAPGVKKVIPGLRRGRPGDGTPVTQVHPRFAALQAAQATAGVVREGWLSMPLDAWQVNAWLPESRESGLVQVAPLAPGEFAAADGSFRAVMDGDQAATFRFSAPAGAEAAKGAVFEMLAVRALSNGLEVEFSLPLATGLGWDPENYYVEQWPFATTKTGQPRRDGVVYPVKSASVSEDGKKVFLEIENLKPGHVIYLRLLPPCLSMVGHLPWSTEAWYTLKALPKDRMGHVLEIPACAQEPPQNVLTEDEKAAGWKLLFDGQTTQGWRGYRKPEMPAGWDVIKGCLARTGPGGDIITNDAFGDFELQIEWRISPAGNSGIFYRVDESVGGAPYESGPEMQVLDNFEHADGRNPLTSAGSNYGLYAPTGGGPLPVGVFNRVRIKVQGNHVEHWLNGVKVVEYELNSPDWKQRVADSKFKAWPKYGQIARGHIVLQDHGDKVWYRNIKIRELGKQ